MQELHEKIERSLLKIALTVFCLILLLGLGGYFSLTAFRAWQVRRLLAEANALVTEGNYNRASLDARRVLELDPETADAMRLIARSAENVGLRSAIEFWRRVHLDPDRAYRLAREVHEQEPKNVDFAATYAFALYLQGDVEKASQLLAGFSETELERPQIAAYYGVILAGSGDFPRAAKFLDLGAKANLLPEERKLVEKAQLTIARR